MTRKQHRRNKAKNLEQKKTHQDICTERPEWADDEKVEENNKNWLTNFLTEVKMAISKREQVSNG